MIPTRGRVIITPDPKEQMTPGGIIIPDNSHQGQKPATTGVIKTLGRPPITSKGYQVDWELNEGDRVIYGEYAEKLELENGDIILGDYTEILAVLPKGAKAEAEDGMQPGVDDKRWLK